MFETLTRFFKKPARPLYVREVKTADNKAVDPQTREKIRKFIDDETMDLILNLVESQKPSTLRAGSGRTVEEMRYSAERRLHQLQGWESFRNTLLNLRFTPDEVASHLEETYPEQ